MHTANIHQPGDTRTETSISTPFTPMEKAAGIYHVAGRIPTGEAREETMGDYSGTSPYPTNEGELRRKVAHFFGFNEVRRLPWANTIGFEGLTRVRHAEGTVGAEALRRMPDTQKVAWAMRRRIAIAKDLQLSPSELDIALAVFQKSKPLDQLQVFGDGGTVRAISQRERTRIQTLVGHIFDLPGVSV